MSPSCYPSWLSHLTSFQPSFIKEMMYILCLYIFIPTDSSTSGYRTCIMSSTLKTISPLIPLLYLVETYWFSLQYLKSFSFPTFLRRRRQWHPTPVLLPRKSHGQRSLVSYSPWAHKESDTTERLTDTHTSVPFAVISLGFHWGSFLTHIFPSLIWCLV